MRNKLVISFTGVILWILAVNFLSNLVMDSAWKSQALSIAMGLLVGMIFGIYISNSVTKNLFRLVEATTVVSEGDLRQEIDVKATDEIGKLAASFKAMVLNLRQIVANVKKGSQKVIQSSDEVYDSIKKLSGISEQFASEVEKVIGAAQKQFTLLSQDSLALKSISDSVGKIATMANVASLSASRAVKNSYEGKNAAESAIRQIQGVFSQVEKSILLTQGLGNKIIKMSRVMEIITDIARKTDMLSLNATVEASKAGEYGKGFGIVAEEIRYLTEESKSSAKEISLLIEEIQSENAAVKTSIGEGVAGINRGRETMGTLIKNFDHIVDEVTKLGGGFEEISIETNRQAMDSKTIAQAFEELTKFAEANSLAMQKSNAVMGEQKKILEQTKASSQNLMDTAHKLNEAVAKFKVADE